LIEPSILAHGPEGHAGLQANPAAIFRQSRPESPASIASPQLKAAIKYLSNLFLTID